MLILDNVIAEIYGLVPYANNFLDFTQSEERFGIVPIPFRNSQYGFFFGTPTPPPFLRFSVIAVRKEKRLSR